jgi:hypothetical protein
MTADLNNPTSENTSLIQEITSIGLEMGLDSTVINAAINIANAESSLRYDAQAPNSTAWGPLQGYFTPTTIFENTHENKT